MDTKSNNSRVLRTILEKSGGKEYADRVLATKERVEAIGRRGDLSRPKAEVTLEWLRVHPHKK